MPNDAAAPQKHPNVCLFCGHRDAPDSLYEFILSAAELLIQSGEVDEFWSGACGKFDLMGERAIRQLQLNYSRIKLILVPAYAPAPGDFVPNGRFFGKYDGIYLPEIGSPPPNAAIARRNQLIAAQAGHVIAYVNRTFGGAANTLRRAISCGAHIFLLRD